MTYMVCDGDGYALTDGLQEHEAERVAQSMANDRLESVWLSESDSEDEGEEFAPDERNSVVKARLALAEWEVDEADETEISAVFAAIYDRVPEADDEYPVDLIYAAEKTLDANQAARIIRLLS